MKKEVQQNSRGFMLADTMTGIAITVILVIATATTASLQRRATHRLSDLQLATELAETRLNDLHEGRINFANPPIGQTVKVEPLKGGDPVLGYSWVRVTASCNGHIVALSGLAKDASGPKGGPLR